MAHIAPNIGAVKFIAVASARGILDIEKTKNTLLQELLKICQFVI